MEDRRNGSNSNTKYSSAYRVRGDRGCRRPTFSVKVPPKTLNLASYVRLKWRNISSHSPTWSPPPSFDYLSSLTTPFELLLLESILKRRISPSLEIISLHGFYTTVVLPFPSVSSRLFQGDEKKKIKIRLLIPRVSSRRNSCYGAIHARFVSLAILLSLRILLGGKKRKKFLFTFPFPPILQPRPIYIARWRKFDELTTRRSINSEPLNFAQLPATIPAGNWCNECPAGKEGRGSRETDVGSCLPLPVSFETKARSTN